MSAGSFLQRGVKEIGRAALDRVGALGGRVRNLREAQRSVTIGRAPEEVHAFFSDPQRLSPAFGHFAELTAAGPDRVRWRARGAQGETLEWDAQVVDERPGELLHWRSVEGAPVQSEGHLTFRLAPNEQGTEVTLRLRVDAPGEGGEPSGPLALSADVIAIKGLYRAKALMETGEAPTLAHNPAARQHVAPGHAH
jgi:uncharacterized membrane protein